MSQLAWTHAHETLIWASKGKGARHTFNYDLINSLDPAGQVSSVWRIPTVPKQEKLHGYHPTQKPLRLVRRALVASTQEGDLIFDPFTCSGTTAVTAKELGRFFVGAELEAEFVKLAARRIKAARRDAVLREHQQGRHNSKGKELSDVRKLIWELPNVVQLLQCNLRAAELDAGGENPSIGAADRLARALGTTLSEILAEVERGHSHGTWEEG